MIPPPIGARVDEQLQLAFDPLTPAQQVGEPGAADDVVVHSYNLIKSGKSRRGRHRVDLKTWYECAVVADRHPSRRSAASSESLPPRLRAASAARSRAATRGRAYGPALYEPNSFNGPVQTNQELYNGIPVTGASGHYPQIPRQVDDFKQAGDLYRLQPKDAQQRLVDNIAGSLGQVSREDIIARSVDHFRRADPEFGRRVAEGVAAVRGVAAAGAAR